MHENIDKCSFKCVACTHRVSAVTLNGFFSTVQTKAGQRRHVELPEHEWQSCLSVGATIPAAAATCGPLMGKRNLLTGLVEWILEYLWNIFQSVLQTDTSESQKGATKSRPLFRLSRLQLERFYGFILAAGCVTSALHQSACQDFVVGAYVHSVSARQGNISTVFKSQVRSSVLSVRSKHIQGCSYSSRFFVCKFLDELPRYLCSSVYNRIITFKCGCLDNLRRAQLTVWTSWSEHRATELDWFKHELKKETCRQNRAAVSGHFQLQGEWSGIRTLVPTTRCLTPEQDVLVGCREDTVGEGFMQCTKNSTGTQRHWIWDGTACGAPQSILLS